MSEGPEPRRTSDVHTTPGLTVERPVLAATVREAVLQILPKEWAVLPDGRATHSVIATEVLSRLD